MNIDDDENKKKLGLGFMSKLNVKNNDIIGIMIQQSNLPMIQFYINGIIQHQLSINRFRGTVYPSFYIPQNNNENNSIHIKVIFREKDFKQTIPNNCSPVIVARGLV